MSNSAWYEQWDPDTVTIGDDSVPDNWKVCVIDGVYFGGNEYNGWLGARISSVFVIFGVSLGFTIFPLLAKRSKKLRIPEVAYLFAKQFGTGVIVATAFVHLLDPAYGEIGPNTCVGMTGNWAIYSWVPAIILATVFFIFILDLFSAVYVERKYGVTENHNHSLEGIVASSEEPHVHEESGHVHDHDHTHNSVSSDKAAYDYDSSDNDSLNVEKSFESQIAAFLILEFGVVFHSVMIGLNLGACGDEFKTLYPVLVFHQSFEGLGIGARLSAIPFPKEKNWWPWALCLAYGLTTPICVAIGLGVRTTYDSNSFTANIIQGVLDSISAGILIYTGLVELLARDFIFNEHRTKSLKKLTFMIVCTLWGAGIMALLGKWA